MNPEIETISNLLKKAKRPVISELLEKIWDLPLSEYSNSLWQKKVNYQNMEKEMIDAFEKEFLSQQY